MNQLLDYILVGGFVTLVDLALYSFLTGRRFRLPRVASNVASTTAGMALGFTLHFALVFHPEAPRLGSRMVAYLVTVSLSVYGVQNAVIHLLDGVWREPARLAQGLARTLMPGSETRFSGDFIDRMTGKVAAAAAGMLWNYVWFKYVVYA